MDSAAEPRFAFDDSRRLTGPNRWFGGTAAVLEALGPRAHDAATHLRWADDVRRLVSALGWPEPSPVAHRHAQGTTLAFAAPEAALFTATEVNEWAWETACGTLDGFDQAHGGLADPVAHFAATAAAERSLPFERLVRAASERGVPVYADDDALTLGAGSSGRTWPRAALPLPMDVPWADLHDIPKALVTGSNGKTTTVRLIAAMARAAGQTPGLSSTEGVWAGTERVAAGDYSGPAGARAVLRRPEVMLAVLETARGGIARRGLAVRSAEVAVVTNISADHFGEYGIDDEAGLAALKLVVARAVADRGCLVLNADDEVLVAAADALPYASSARRALFGADHDAPRLAVLRRAGGSTCAVRAGRLVLVHSGSEHDLGAIESMPLAFGGAAVYNVANLAAAALAAHAGLGLPLAAVQQVLMSFGAAPTDNPGRLERWPYRGATVLIDYAHNPDGLARLLAVAHALAPKRLLLLLGQAGNRSDDAIGELARTAARAAPDLVLIKELSGFLRGRPPGEVPALLERVLLDAGVASEALVFGGEELPAALTLLDRAQPGDVVVLPVHQSASRAPLLGRLRQAP